VKAGLQIGERLAIAKGPVLIEKLRRIVDRCYGKVTRETFGRALDPRIKVLWLPAQGIGI
jgi:hypothetical protein